MKKLPYKELFGFCIFISIFLFSVVLLSPIYRRVSNELHKTITRTTSSLKDSYGIYLKYESLSPSIFTGIKILGVEVLDSKEHKLLEVDKIFLRYDFLKLFTRDFSHAFSDFTLDGVRIEVTEEDLKLFTKDKKEKKQSSFSVPDFVQKVPFDIFIKNIHLNYSSDSYKSDVSLKNFYIDYENNSLSYHVKSSGSCYLSNLVKKSSYNGSFSLDGSFFPDLNNSFCRLRLMDLSDGNYKLSRLNLLFSYEDESLTVRTIQNAYPFILNGSYNVNSGMVDVEIEAKNLTASHVVSTVYDTPLMKKLREFVISTKTSASYNTRNNKFHYSSQGNVKVGSKIFNDGFNLQYKLMGNEKRVQVSYVNALGPKIDVSFNGNYIYKGMLLNGTFDVKRFELPSGADIKTEVFFQSKSTSGFEMFSSNLMLGSRSLTALNLDVRPQNDSVDFNFSCSDYSHEEDCASINLSGSYLTKSRYLQSNLYVQSMFLDSLMLLKDSLSNKESSYASLSPYVFNADIYFSTDFKTFSFNAPTILVADTKKDKRFCYISLDGNDTSIQCSRFDVADNGRFYHFQGQFEKSPDTKDAFFIIDSQIGSVPYHVAGNIMPGSLMVSGDYGFVCDVTKNGKILTGNVALSNLPYDSGSALFSLSTNLSCTYTMKEGFTLDIQNLELSETGKKYSFLPKLLLQGSVSKYGLMFNNVCYSDNFSTLQGKTELSWSLNNKILSSSNLSINLKNPFGPEAIDMSVELMNPDELPFSKDNLLQKFYINSKLDINNFGLNRFVKEHNDSNSMTSSLVFTGNLTNPYMLLNIASINLLKGGKTLSLSGDAYVEDHNLKTQGLKFTYGNTEIKNIDVSFDFDSFTGKANSTIDAIVMKKTVHLPLEISLQDTNDHEGLIPEDFVLTISSPNVSGTLFKENFPFNISFNHTGDTTTLFTSGLLDMYGAISGSNVNIEVLEGGPVNFNVNGTIGEKNIALDIKNINLNLGQMFNSVNIDKFKLYKGSLRGSLKIKGLRKDPDFIGAFSFSNLDFSLPTIVPSHITINKLIAAINHTQLDIPKVKALVKNDIPVYASASVFFDRWSFDRLEASIYTDKDTYIPGDLNVRLCEITGDTSLDLELLLEDRYLDITGDVKVRNGMARAKTKEITLGTAPLKRAVYTRSDLNITLGSHVSFRFDPLIRGVFTPDTSFKFKYDMSEKAFSIDGDITLRSGDIAYLNRNFYLKNGTLKFNGNEEQFNPRVTLTAETREKDEDGNDVRIIMSVNNQNLLGFTPQFSSIPVKSETEIRNLLGQIAVGDSDDMQNFMLATGDYVLQSTIGRSIENKLRDLFNFDILSVRTNILRNVLKMNLTSNTRDENGNTASSQATSQASGTSGTATSSSTSKDSEKTNIGIGNYFDNSTVYIGKYFGSALYADALMHWTYDESRVNDDITTEGLIFQPEIGIELESPLANIRWNMAPNIDALMRNRVSSSTSVTLSWKFTF